MGIGAGIFLLAVGAVLTFAVHATVAGLDIRVVGVILMASGALGLLLSMLVFAPRRQGTVTQTTLNPTGGAVLGATDIAQTTVIRDDVI